MPDLTPVTMARCASLDGTHYVPSSDGTKVYTVEISGSECHCTCPAGNYRPDEWCRHIKAVRGKGCCWNELIDGGHSEDGKCPICGGVVECFRAEV